MIVAAVATLGFAGTAPAQMDAAEKAKEGGIEHWIEYYKGEQRKPAATSSHEPVTSPADRAAPAERAESDAPSPEKAEGK